MKNIFLIAFVLLGYNTLVAQDFQGKAIYQSKTTIDINLENRQMPAERKKQIMERIKNASEKIYELSFDRTASLYIEEEKLDQPTTSTGGGGRGGIRFAGTESGGKYYKNVQDKSYTHENELFGKKFLIKDSLPQWEWTLGSETKKIGNYTCYKATATKALDTVMTNLFRRGPGRDRSNTDVEKPKDTVQKDTVNTSLFSRIEKPKERTITVWYTPEIPVSQGPGNYWGLPGLILEANDGRTALLCTKIVMNTAEKITIEAPKKGKEITQEDYDKLRVEKAKEMSERFRSGNRGGGNRGRSRN